jgi:NADP-dependent 3-hydroxy acid dehydrogenase YdfG
MKVAITGHTSGIGKALYTKFSPDVIGFSRSTGFDISKSDNREKIREMSKDCDIFINNAYNNYAQIDILYLMHTAWINTNKIIINISSNASRGKFTYPHVYAVTKTALDKASEQLSKINDACRIINLRPGYVDTPGVANKPHLKMSVDSIIHCINFVINCPDDCIINEMTILPWKAK